MLGILCELEKGPQVAVFQTFQEVWIGSFTFLRIRSPGKQQFY